MERRQNIESQRHTLQIQLANYLETRNSCHSSNRQLFDVLVEYAQRELEELNDPARLPPVASEATTRPGRGRALST